MSRDIFQIFFLGNKNHKLQVGILPFHERIQFRRRFWTQFSTKDLAATSGILEEI